MRRLVRETRLSPDNLIAPLFVCSGEGVRREITSMPGCFQLSPELIVQEARELASLGVPGVILFGVPDRKDPEGYGAADPEGPVPVALKALKRELPDLLLWADVCLCEYTDHGHCGPIVMGPDGRADVGNDVALPRLAAAALAYARGGADVVAPSDMMDGRVAAIRAALDGAGFPETAILSYAAKTASAFYGPFREAAGSAPKFGDRRAYQMDPANRREAMREIALDLDEGADAVMVKPALAYLDVIREARQRFDAPIAAYNVSGEYAMVKAAAANGWIDERRVVLEILTGIVRAGADFVLTYHAADAARWIEEG
jgi:porphobilinogen synthase